MRLLLHRLTTDRQRRQPSKIRRRGESLRGASSASWEEDECELFFFCSYLIKANNGLSRSLYAYHRQTAGCNELLSATWQISRKQAAVLVSAVVIGEFFFLFFQKKFCSTAKRGEEKAAQCPCPYSRRCLENFVFSPWLDLSREKKKLIFSLAKLKLLKNTRQ